MTLYVTNCSLFRNKADLVRAIQRAEGFEACFRTGKAHACGQDACLWREECVEHNYSNLPRRNVLRSGNRDPLLDEVQL